MIYFKSENSKLYKVKKSETERSVAEVKFRYYKYRSAQCLFKEWESRYQVKKRKQIILTVKLTFISERLSANSLSHMQEQKKLILNSVIV